MKARNLSTKPRPWERLSAETDAGWAAFLLYRDTGTPLGATPGRRTVAALARANPKGSSAKTMNIWARKWDWKVRARAYDRHFDQLALDTTERTLREMKKRHVKASMRLQHVATLELEKLAAQAEKTGRLPDLKPSDLSRMLGDGIKLERLTRGEVTERVEGKLDLTKLSITELKALKSLTTKAKAQD